MRHHETPCFNLRPYASQDEIEALIHRGRYTGGKEPFKCAECRQWHLGDNPGTARGALSIQIAYLVSGGKVTGSSYPSHDSKPARIAKRMIENNRKLLEAPHKKQVRVGIDDTPVLVLNPDYVKAPLEYRNGVLVARTAKEIALAVKDANLIYERLGFEPIEA